MAPMENGKFCMENWGGVEASGAQEPLGRAVQLKRGLACPQGVNRLLRGPFVEGPVHIEKITDGQLARRPPPGSPQAPALHEWRPCRHEDADGCPTGCLEAVGD